MPIEPVKKVANSGCRYYWRLLTFVKNVGKFIAIKKTCSMHKRKQLMQYCTKQLQYHIIKRSNNHNIKESQGI